MTLQKSQIIMDARIAMGYAAASAEPWLEGDCESLMLDDVIASCILPAIMAEPEAWEGRSRPFSADVLWTKRGAGYVLLPPDFDHLVAFKMSDWSKAVYKAITPDMPEYSMQQSRFKGIRGSALRPVCAIVRLQHGLALEFYSCRSGEAYPTIALYAARPAFDAAGNIEIADAAYPSVVLRIASMAKAIIAG